MKSRWGVQLRLCGYCGAYHYWDQECERQKEDFDSFGTVIAFAGGLVAIVLWFQYCGVPIP